MLFWNDGTDEANAIQNKFTRCVVDAVTGKRNTILKARNKLRKNEVSVDFQKKQVWRSPEEGFMENLDLLNQIENEALLLALMHLKQRERDILIARFQNQGNYNDLAEAFGIGYKGVTAVYYRALEKLRKEMEAEDR